MRQHKAVAQVILILSVVYFVLAAPVVREIHRARDDVIVRVLAEDVGAVAVKRGGAFGKDPAPLEDSESEWGSDSDSDSDLGDEGYETASDEPFTPDRSPIRTEPSTPDGSSIRTESSTSDGSSTRTESPPPSERPKIMTPEEIKATKIAGTVGVFTAAVLGLVIINTSLKDNSAS